MRALLISLFAVVCGCAHAPPTPTFEQCEDATVHAQAVRVEPYVSQCLGEEQYALCLQALADEANWVVVGCAVQEVLAAQALAPRY